MHRIWPDTVVARAAAILVVALLAVHVIGYLTYRAGMESIANAARDRGLAERVVSIKRAIASIPEPEKRDKAAHALSSGSLEVHWGKVSQVVGNVPPTSRAAATAERLKQLVPDLGSESFRIGYADDGALAAGETEAYRHMLVLSVRLEDQSWVNFAAPTLGSLPHTDWMQHLAALCIGVVIILIAILLLRWVTRPLKVLAEAAEGFSLDEKHERLDESGPAEVRRAARAFNSLRDRIQTLVAERTQALAAVSHDLRTPITRVKLRSELYEDETTRDLIEADLSEMESMIDSTLEYLRAGESNEPVRLIDLSAVVQTVVDDAIDRGRDITFSGLEHAVVRGRLVAMKRALWNVVGNALKYATQVEVNLTETATAFLVTVTDDGPGVPNELIERLFEPFFRVEESRNRETGGTGLGLTITRAIMRAAGGDVTITNNPGAGLRVCLSFPKAAATADAAPVHQTHRSNKAVEASSTPQQS
jgi:signal transduction histidine kinase